MRVLILLIPIALVSSYVAHQMRSRSTEETQSGASTVADDRATPQWTPGRVLPDPTPHPTGPLVLSGASIAQPQSDAGRAAIRIEGMAQASVTVSLDGMLELAGRQWRHDATIDSLAALLQLIEDRDAAMRRRADVAVVTSALAAAVLARLDGILDGETETAERMTSGSDPRRAP